MTDIPERKCLRCRKPFKPKHSGNFLCRKCNSFNSRKCGRIIRVDGLGAGQPRGGIKYDV